jgi:hypothetical protein
MDGRGKVMADEIQQRIDRIYAAIGSVEMSHPNDLRPRVYHSEKGTLLIGDFRAGQTDAELINQAMSLIHNIANLYDHLKKWAKSHGVPESRVKDAFDGCGDQAIIRDLSNRDKHGPSRDSGHSGKSPELIEVNRVMRLRGKLGVRTIGMAMGANGNWEFPEGTTHKAVVTGIVIDKNSDRMGDLYEIAMKAVKTWERFAVDHGLLQID